MDRRATFLELPSARTSLGRALLVATVASFRVHPCSALEGPIALLPPANLSGTKAPLTEVASRLADECSRAGLELLDPDELERFLSLHRVRDTSGVASDTADALGRETKAAAVLVSSVDLFVEGEPPAFAMTARLVTAERDPLIVWMDSVALAGDASPGLLGLGVVSDVETLIERACSTLASSLGRHLRSQGPIASPKARASHRPRRLWRVPERIVPSSARPRIAVLPFLDRTGRRRAGDLVALGLVRWLSAQPEVRVIEPGVVRSALLASTLIPAGGISLPQGDLLRLLLGADWVVSGEVFDYQERAPGGGGSPFVHFGTTVLDTARRQVVWVALSYASGDDGVVWFDRGRILTAQELASRMALGVVGELLRRDGGLRAGARRGAARRAGVP